MWRLTLKPSTSFATKSVSTFSTNLRQNYPATNTNHFYALWSCTNCQKEANCRSKASPTTTIMSLLRAASEPFGKKSQRRKKRSTSRPSSMKLARFWSATLFKLIKATPIRSSQRDYRCYYDSANRLIADNWRRSAWKNSMNLPRLSAIISCLEVSLSSKSKNICPTVPLKDFDTISWSISKKTVSSSCS